MAYDWIVAMAAGSICDSNHTRGYDCPYEPEAASFCAWVLEEKGAANGSGLPPLIPFHNEAIRLRKPED